MNGGVEGVGVGVARFGWGRPWEERSYGLSASFTKYTRVPILQLTAGGTNRVVSGVQIELTGDRVGSGTIFGPDGNIASKPDTEMVPIRVTTV